MRTATLREPEGVIARTRKRENVRGRWRKGKTVREKRVIGLARERLSSSLFQTIPGGRFSHRRRRDLSSHFSNSYFFRRGAFDLGISVESYLRA